MDITQMTLSEIFSGINAELLKTRSALRTAITGLYIGLGILMVLNVGVLVILIF